jgi:hypothetical protein
VIFRGYFPAPGKLISTKNAVQPAAGGSTRAIHVFGPLGVNGVLRYAAPIVSRRKFRAAGFVACHSNTALGSCFVTTLIEPSRSKLQRTSGRAVPATIAA